MFCERSRICWNSDLYLWHSIDLLTLFRIELFKQKYKQEIHKADQSRLLDKTKGHKQHTDPSLANTHEHKSTIKFCRGWTEVIRHRCSRMQLETHAFQLKMMQSGICEDLVLEIKFEWSHSYALAQSYLSETPLLLF